MPRKYRLQRWRDQLKHRSSKGENLIIKKFVEQQLARRIVVNGKIVIPVDIKKETDDNGTASPVR